MKSNNKFRLRIVSVGIILVALALLLSLYNTQILNGSAYRKKADSQHVKPQVALFDRGSILLTSKDGSRVAGATVSDGYLVYMNPSVIQSPEQVYQVLAQYLKLDKADFIKKASKSTDIYKELAHRVSADISNAIGGLGIIGLGVTRETWRSYPIGTMSPQTIGLVGESSASSSLSVVGRYGIERTYETVLNRPELGSSVSVFSDIFADNFLDASDTTSTSKPGNIITSLEPTVGSYVQKVLEDTSTVWHPDEIGGIVMNPQNGEIVSLVSLPTFDPNDTSKVKDVRVFSNPLVENVYEMGSIMKPLTMSIGLDSGVITPESTYDDTGTMTLNGKKISNYDGKARGVIPMQQILSQSLNVGAANIALKAGAANMYSYVKSFGLGSKTGIDLPNESAGLMGNLKKGKDIDIATASYGQGIAISPLSMTRALSVLANGGYLITPHVAKKIEFDDGTSKNLEFPRTGPVLKNQTVEDVTRMLVEVVDKALKNGTIKHDKYSVAAKTGTAQIADHVNGGYYSDRYLHSFFGYFPAFNPKFIIFLYQVYPRGAEYASETLTDPFNKISSFLIDYYDIPPDR